MHLIHILVFITAFWSGFPVNKVRFTSPEIYLKEPAKEAIIFINYGKNGRIAYNIKTGEADILDKNQKIITGAYALVKESKATYSSKDFTSRNYSKSDIKNAFGRGTKHVITCSGPNLPNLQQIFYTYPDREYFFTEVLLEGQNLSSNYMAPLISQNANIQASGDNRTLFVPFDNDTFISYNAKLTDTELTNTSAEVGAIYENNTRKGLVVGSVEHTVWKSGVKTSGKKQILSELLVWGGYTEEKVTRDKIPHGAISGNIIKSPKVFVGYFNDWRTGLEEYGKANRLAEPPYVFNWTKPTPFGWNSWGVIQSKINFENAIAVTNYFADSLQAFRNNNTAYIDLDSYWDNMVKGGLTGDFSKLKAFADHCKSKGLEPGVYWAPFTDWGWKSTRVRQVEGSTYNFSDIWTKTNGAYHDLDGGRALDPTHPGTRQRMALVIGKLKDCGFTMIKIDFLGHAAVESDSFYDKSVKTGMQAYRKGMEYLVDLLDGQMLIYAAISPSLATGRYAHTRRIACDAWKTIKDTRYTLNSVNYGWWQTYLYNFIDADHVVFGDETAGANRARLTSGVITGTLFTGDDFSKAGPWSGRARKLLQNPEILHLAKNGKAFRPVEGNTGEGTNEMFVKTIDNTLYLAVLNYADSSKTFDINLNRIGLKSEKKYAVSELFQNVPINLQETLQLKLNGGDAAIYKINKN